MSNLTSWCWKIGQGHQSSNLTKTQNLTKTPFRYINGISLGLMQVIFGIMFTSKNCKFSCWNQPLWPRKIGQGHPASNLTKTLLRYIHGISLGPIRLIFVELSCLHAKTRIVCIRPKGRTQCIFPRSQHIPVCIYIDQKCIYIKLYSASSRYE